MTWWQAGLAGFAGAFIGGALAGEIWVRRRRRELGNWEAQLKLVMASAEAAADRLVERVKQDRAL